jgi:exopolysaccharide biosynthesis polyprenyl glycosylphosphotransferase
MGSDALSSPSSESARPRAGTRKAAPKPPRPRPQPGDATAEQQASACAAEASPLAARSISPEEIQRLVPPSPTGRNWANRFYRRYGKRILDLALTIPALVVLLPVMGILALLIRLDSPGPVIYTCRRVGEGGRLFRFYKFRSMVVGADRIREELRPYNEVDGPVFKMAEDPRVTRIGRFLRRSSLDELPQLFNVLKGDMSLVGPRPPLPEEVVQYEPWQRRRLSVRPGLTCFWQVSGRSRLNFEEWVRLDIRYIEEMSLGVDLKIILRTIPAVLSGEGAY